MFPCLLFALLGTSQAAHSQEITKDSILHVLRTTPSFTAYRDNYWVTGTALREKPTVYNSDAKFQISLRHRLTDRVLPFDSYLFITYTQRSFWDIYRDSRPFAATNYHPGIGLAKLIFKDMRFRGTASIQIEHESNGGGIASSVSWNYVSFNYIMPVSPKTTTTFRVWIPFYSRNLADLLKYAGFTEIRYMRGMAEDTFHAALTIRKGYTWNWTGSIQGELYYNPFKSANQYIFLQWFYGYAENLSEFTMLTNNLRIGVAIRPYYWLFY